jgi:hypothetical protein
MSAAQPVSTNDDTSTSSSTEASPRTVRVESILDTHVPYDVVTTSSNLTDPNRDVQPYDTNVMTSFCASRRDLQTDATGVHGSLTVDAVAQSNIVSNNPAIVAIQQTGTTSTSNPVRHHNYPPPRNGRNQTRLRPSTKLCQCFSPTQSDSEDDNTTQQFTISGEVGAHFYELSKKFLQPSSAVPSHLPAVTPAVAAGRSSANHFPSIVSLAREIRCRFALAADAHNQPTNPAQFRRNMRSGACEMQKYTHRVLNLGIEMSAAPYPVHSTTEYTHYLVPDLDRITNASYYWGVMDRFEAEKLLESKPEGENSNNYETGIIFPNS